MGILDKIMFWKNDGLEDTKDFPDFSSNKDLGAKMGLPDSDMKFTEEGGVDLTGNDFEHGSLPSHENKDSFSHMREHQSSFQQPQYQQSSRDRDMEVISAKLDAIRATLESLNQRVAAIEQIARSSNESHHQNSW